MRLEGKSGAHLLRRSADTLSFVSTANQMNKLQYARIQTQKIAEQQGARTGQLAAIHMKSMSKFYAMLSPAQKTKADELSAQFKAAKQHRAQK